MRFLIRVLLLALGLAFVSLAPAGPVHAEDTTASGPAVKIDKRKLLVQPRAADGSVAITPFLEDPVLWARDLQQSFYGKLSGALRKMTSGSALMASWSLVLLSFGYGVFHAAGPGHGKVVISAWLLATENELRRGILISFMSAIIQALTAIVLVSILFLVVVNVRSTARDAADILESASFAMIGLLGVYVVWTGIRSLVRRRSAPEPSHGVVQTSAQSFTLHRFDSFEPKAAASPATDGHVHGPDCGHVHLPDASALKGEWSLRQALSLAFAVGIRPCTGAILVLLFAGGLGLYWAGIFSVFAMAVGTFLTVSVIAAIAVYSKKLAVKLTRGDERWPSRLDTGLRLVCGAGIAGLGTIMFLGSLSGTNAMM
jgi:ABC-type nickel/cobalt efflux system permease component RcnA